MVLVGCNDLDAGKALEEVLKPVVWSRPQSAWLSLIDAELAKISVNAYVTMKISFANQLAAICERLPGANASSVLGAVGLDRRIGLFYLRPGGPFGGPCFPRDNKAFQRLATNVNADAPLARATDDVNNRIVDRIIAMLDDTGSIAVLGLSYKPHTHVTEASFGTKLVEQLLAAGREVDFHDPAVSDESAQALLKRSKQVIIATAHDEYKTLDYSRLNTVIDVWGIVSVGDNVQTIGLGPDE
jgi:UDPglucose 6-dehydrogenase